jgi:chemosensory pili system protein ChpA (sensor histidine kinase/response regulator)
MPEVAEQTLYVVAKELATTLGDARVSLEAYAEETRDATLLARCADALHEVHGVLRLVEVYGAALLAEEMEQVARYLIGSAEENRNQPESLDALMRAMVQLPAYLERVLGGGRDLALVLLPLLNDLRAVRGNALLSEGTLLLLNLTSDRQARPPGQDSDEPPLAVAQWARRLRPRFQVGLLGWIRGERTAQHLEILAAVAERLEQVATRQPVFQLWWVVGAIVEALREGGLESTATIKRLLGQADRELRKLYESGEARYAEAPPLDLLNNLLYYVARATNAGPRTVSVRASFKLQELLPVSEQVEQERENLSAPSVKLMETVAAAIKEDLSRVKDVLDIFVRKGSTQVEELAAQLEMLRKISDTLGVLGLGGLRSQVQSQIQRLQEIVVRKTPPADITLVDIAAALINVEDNLDAQLVQLIMPNRSAGGEHDQDAEFQQVQQAVLRECIVNLARIKETIAAVVASHEPSGSDQVAPLLRGMRAGLLMLGRARAVEVLEAISQHVSGVLAPDRPVSRERLDRLADAIVSVEYYMETLQSGRSDPWYMLDNAETCLRALDAADAETYSEPEPANAGLAARARVDGMPGYEPTTVRTTVLKMPSGAGPPAAVVAPDPDLLALFIEEAREEVTRLGEFFPAWDENPLQQEALLRVRRSFHTLKGSGRMVGARQVGEFAWAVENLLNRVISGTLSRTPGMLALLREAMAMLPQLVDQLETGRAPPAEAGLIVGRVHAYAEGRAPEQTLAAAAIAAPASPGPVAVAPAAAAEPLFPSPPRPDQPDAPSLISTEVLLSHDPAVPRPPPPAPGRTVLEVPSRFVRVTDDGPRTSERSWAAPPPPPPPSGSEFTRSEDASTDAASDPVLIEIYRGEVSSHVAAVRQYLVACEKRFAPFAVTEALHRACHTLAGASKMAEAHHGIRLAEPLNLYIRKLYDHGLGLPEAGRRVLTDIVAAVDDIAAHFDEASSYFTTHAELLARRAYRRTDSSSNAHSQPACRGLEQRFKTAWTGSRFGRHPPPIASGRRRTSRRTRSCWHGSPGSTRTPTARSSRAASSPRRPRPTSPPAAT